MSAVRYFDPPAALASYQVVYFGAPMENGAFPFRTEDGKWGLASENVILCPPVYDALSPMPDREGQYLLCCRGFLWGLLSAEGSEVLACEWQGVKLVSDSLITVRQKHLWGFARMELGRFRPVTPVAYSEWKKYQTKDGLNVFFVLQKTPWGTMNHNGSHMTLSRWGVLDGRANLLATPQWKDVDFRNFSDIWANTLDGKLMLMEDWRLTQPLKEGAYR